MGYIQARADVAFVREYHDRLVEFWNLEAKAAPQVERNFGYVLKQELQAQIQRIASQEAGYLELRKYLSRNNVRLQRLARSLGLSTTVQSLPPRAVGGAVITLDIFDAVLSDNSYGGIEQSFIYDRMQAIMGQAEEREGRELRRMLNPLHWVREALFLILRIPFILVEATGFNVGKIEDNLFGKGFKLLSLFLLVWLALNYFGFSREDLVSIARSIKN